MLMCRRSATTWDYPDCIVRPVKTAQLQDVVKYLTSHHVQFAIRSGGYNPSPNATHVEHGILIDMSGFNEITYNAAAGTAVVGSGNKWADVYTALDKHKVTVVGGRLPGIGVGGFIIGGKPPARSVSFGLLSDLRSSSLGGLSYLSELQGLGCDNVVEFEVVLANGTLVKASQTENKDLHWALKGGGNNFGESLHGFARAVAWAQGEQVSSRPSRSTRTTSKWCGAARDFTTTTTSDDSPPLYTNSN